MKQTLTFTISIDLTSDELRALGFRLSGSPRKATSVEVGVMMQDAVRAFVDKTIEGLAGHREKWQLAMDELRASKPRGRQTVKSALGAVKKLEKKMEQRNAKTNK